MSWSDTLLDGSFRGVPLHVRSESLGGKRNLAEHGVPYRDGDDIEDMGRSGRRYSMKLVCWGDTYERHLQRILEALDTLGPGELVHPVYGSRTVVVESWNVSHEADHIDRAEIDVEFVESTPSEPFFDRWFVDTSDHVLMTPDDLASWQDKLRDWLARLDSLFALVQQYIGGGWVGLLEELLGLPGIALRLAQLRSQILGVVYGLNGLARRSSRAFDPFTDLARTQAEIRLAIAAAMPEDGRRLLSGEGVPARLPTGVPTAQQGADATAGPAGQGLPVTEPLDGAILAAVDALLQEAQRGSTPTFDALELPAGLPTDPAGAVGWSLAALVITELAVAKGAAVAGVLDAELAAPTHNPDEIERLVNGARALLEAAILLRRTLFTVEPALHVIQPLRSSAALMQAQAQNIIPRRPPLVRRAVESGGNLRLIAHRWYADHRRAPELLRLNPNLRAPYIVPAGEVLNAYAR
ncbi:DNA circularization N-terminal domain-containing protein [Pseudomonas aeruginosa]|nr:DNA circularization N-terminal domain-containing protein [Pseudomonas aeruginosa]